MTTQFRQHSHEPINIVAPTGGLTVDVPQFVEDLFVIPVASAAAGALCAVYCNGVFRLPKDTSTAFDAGEAVYWDEADGELNDDTGNPCVGHAVESVGTSATHLLVRVIDTPVADAAAALARLDDIELSQTLGTATPKVMSVSDTYVQFTEDAHTYGAGVIDIGDEIEWEITIALTAMNSAYLTTAQMLLGVTAVDEVALASGDDNDWVKLKGKARYTGTTAGNVIAGEGCGSDGGSVTRDTPTQTIGATLPTRAGAVTLTPQIKAATGNAGNTAEITSFRSRVVKGY